MLWIGTEAFEIHLEFPVQTLDEVDEYEWGVVVRERYLNRTLSIGEELIDYSVGDYLLFEWRSCRGFPEWTCLLESGWSHD